MLLCACSVRASSDPFADFYGTYVVNSVYSLDPCLSDSDGLCSSVCCLLNVTVMKTNPPPSQGVEVTLWFDPSTLSRCGLLSVEQQQNFIITSIDSSGINTQIQSEVFVGMLPATIVFAGSGSTTQLQVQLDQCEFQTEGKSAASSRSYVLTLLVIGLELTLLAVL
jgi:hypothetical protein